MASGVSCDHRFEFSMPSWNHLGRSCVVVGNDFIPMPSENKILLILDLDETLIHAREKALERPADFQLSHFHVYTRPHLEAFLEEVRKDFSLAVWSSASDDYVKDISRHIFKNQEQLLFIWGNSRCTYRRNFEPELTRMHRLHHDRPYYYVKPLKKVKRLGFDLKRILIVDDSPYKVADNYGNAIYPKPYEGQADDYELLLLAKYLKTLRDEPNVRRLEKRNWRALTIARNPTTFPGNLAFPHE